MRYIALCKSIAHNTITMEQQTKMGAEIKEETYPSDFGLDQEIQKAIAQHDLEQRQLQEHEKQLSTPQAHTPQHAHEADHETHHALQAGHSDVPHHDATDTAGLGQKHSQDQNTTHESHQTNTHDPHSYTHSPALGDPHSRPGSASLEMDPNHDPALALADGLDSMEEKKQLQLIADELEKATTEAKAAELNSQDTDVHGQDLLHQQKVNAHALAPHIPADSELLATNEALEAYNALTSHVPAPALLSAVHLAALPIPMTPSEHLPARIQLLISTLPVLDNLATQLLRIFTVGPYLKIIDLASNPETPQGAAFRDLTSLFEFTKRLYSEEDPFLTVEHLAPGIWKDGEKTPAHFRSREQTIELTLRKVNLATFLAAVLGTIEVGFFHLNELFLNVFCPSNTLDPANSMSNMSSTNFTLQSGVNIVVGDKVGKVLKPQAVLYLELKTQAYISAIETGERLSQEILDDIIPSNMEEILLRRRGTKSLLPTETDFINRCMSRKDTLLSHQGGQSLSEEYEWFKFLRELFDFVLKNMSFLIWGKKLKNPPRERIRVETPHSDQTLAAVSEREHELPDGSSQQEFNDLTAALLPSEIQEQQIHLRVNPRMGTKLNSRRPWTREEEKALRHALELKGPQWSTILELFGQGGRISEALKNRNQVQLKDKARNWKMFFLKLGLPVPEYLQKVTGDLERDDKLRAKNARNRKTAAAPVPAANTVEESEAKRRKT